MPVLRTAVVLVLAAAMLAFPISPASAARSVRRDVDPVAAVRDRLSPDARTALIRDGAVERRDSVTDVLTSVRDHRDLDAWLSAAAAVVGKQGQTEVAVEAVDEHESGTISSSVPAGDLDGDGAEDLVVLSEDLATESVSVQARRGVDGAVLWEQASGQNGLLAWPLGSDVDGDGVDDLSLDGLTIHTEEVVEECEEFDDEEYCWPVEYRATFTWTIGVASGADGSALWTRDFAGDIDEALTYESTDHTVYYESTDRYELTSTNLYVIPMTAGDLDGNGEDLVVDAVDLDVVEEWASTEAFPLWVDEGSLQIRAATRADVADAATGAVRQTLTDAAPERISFLSPVDDMVGGSGPDLLWDRIIAPDQTYQCVTADVFVDYVGACPDELEGGWALGVELLDGATLAPAWSSTIAGGEFVFGLGGDLSGDGTGDLMVLGFAEDGYTTSVLSGKDGAALWTQTSPDDWFYPTVLAPLDAVAGVDLVTVAFLFEDEGGGIVVDRRSGATGAVISSTTREMPPLPDDADMGAILMYAEGAPDGDGDSIGDLITGFVQVAYTYDDETGPSDEPVVTQSRGFTESGVSGELHRTLSDDENVVWFEGVGDLDGDALVDVLVERYGYDEQADTESGSWAASALFPGADFWTRDAASTFLYLSEAGDQDGVPGQEMLLEQYQRDGAHWSTSTSSVSGISGQNRWTLTAG